MGVNSDYWRVQAKCLQLQTQCFRISIVIENDSEFGLSDCKLEINAATATGQPVRMLEGRRLPDKAGRTWDETTNLRGSHTMQAMLGKKTLDVETSGALQGTRDTD
jgi:hypothetical protein